MDRALIIGAGFAGSTCARVLADRGWEVVLVEQRAHVGGNAFDTYDADRTQIHPYGPHIFHTQSDAVFAFLSRFTDWRPYEHRVVAQVGADRLPVPINLTTLAAFGGDEQAAREAIIRPYTRKQWGCEPEDLSPSVFARIATRQTTDDRYFLDRHQAMPRDGYAVLFARLLDHPAIHVLLQTSSTDARRIVSQSSVVTIMTGPVDAFFDYRYGPLPYRSATFAMQREPRRPHAVTNYPTPAVPYTRVTDFSYLTGQVAATSTCCYETPTAYGPPYWPVPTPAADRLAARYHALARAARPSTYFCGRLATFAYLNMDQSVAQALHVCATILQEH